LHLKPFKRFSYLQADTVRKKQVEWIERNVKLSLKTTTREYKTKRREGKRSEQQAVRKQGGRIKKHLQEVLYTFNDLVSFLI